MINQLGNKQEFSDEKEPRFTLRNDYAFKKVFGNASNKEPLIEFLSLVLKIPKEDVEEITIENPFLENEFFDEKKAILDLKLTLKNGKKINIEMQNYWQSYFIPRVLYYWSKRYIEDFKEKNLYDILKPCISINILNERFKYSNSIHCVYELLEREAHTCLENYLELHFLDLTKLKESDMNLLEKWLLFIKTDEQGVRDMLSMETSAMNEANKVIQAFYTNPEDRYRYEAVERYEAERASLYAEGLKKGVSQGISQGKYEIAKNMKSLGFSMEDILKATELTPQDIKQL